MIIAMSIFYEYLIPVHVFISKNVYLLFKFKTDIYREVYTI